MIDLSSDEDDSIVHLSRESTIEEEESEQSGAHVNDALNRVDSQGRVLVNLNHPAAEDDIFLSAQLARAVKPHQVLLLLHSKQMLGPLISFLFFYYAIKSYCKNYLLS